MNLAECTLQALPAELSAMTGLEELGLSGNKNLQSFPALACAGLNKLKVLSLCECDMEALPEELSAMTGLRELDLLFNSRLQSLPETVFLNPFSAIETIRTRGCPLVCPPVQVCELGVAAVTDYFMALQATVGIRQGRLKILVTGNTMSGKTSLVQAMLSGQPFLTRTEDRTIGVVETTIRFSEATQWKVQDCGGQRAYMLTNQLMVSDNALALIVVDVNQYKATEECFRETIGEYLEVLYERNSKAYVIIVMSKVDQLSDSEHDIRMEFADHVSRCVGRFLNLRQLHVRRMKKSLETVELSQYELCAERLRFLLAQSITVREDVVLTSSAIYEGVGDLWRLLGKLSEDPELLPSIAAQLPASWVALEDHLVGGASPIDIVCVSDVVAQSVAYGLNEGGTRHLLKYPHDVGSLLFLSRHAALEDVVFPSSAFVMDVFKAVFRHDHDRLCYDDERFGGEGITRQQFDEMKRDFVQNATARIPMLRALWSKVPQSAERHFEVFVKMFLSFDFAYPVTSSDDVARILSEVLLQRGLIIHCSSVYDLQPSASGISRTRSAGRAEAAERV